LIEVDYAPLEGIQQGTIKANAVWGTTAVPPQNLDICLDLVGDGKTAAKACMAPDEQVGTSGWTANDLRRGAYILPLPADLDPGNYKLTLTLSEPASRETAGDTAVLGNLVIHPFSPEIETGARWQEGIRLRGGDISENTNNLEVTLYWQTDQPVRDSYKVFLHLQDLDSGEIVAQSDAIPRNWTYPTNEWEPGEIVRDVISIPLVSLPDGSYKIVVGLYDSLTGERLLLPAVGDGGRIDAYDLATWER
jgi:hypothetical protein